MLRATLPATLELAHRVEGDPVARVDPVQAHQVLLNLCINARDAMSESGRITVTARRVRVAEMTCASCRHRFSGEFAELAVADSGSGIAPEVLERMFDPFFSTKEIGQGTGMGLSIVHGVVHDHGGHVLVESGRGAGTTFRVLLPLAGEEASETGAAPDAAVRRERVRCTDASCWSRTNSRCSASCASCCRAGGWRWWRRATRADALHWFSLEPDRFDVVLTDHTMPGMTGMELTRALVARRAGLPVLLYSGRNDLLDADTATAAGVRTLLAKPVDTAALRAALQDALPATST